MHGASLLANNIRKEGKGGSFLYLTVSFSKGTRIYPYTTKKAMEKDMHAIGKYISHCPLQMEQSRRGIQPLGPQAS